MAAAWRAREAKEEALEGLERVSAKAVVSRKEDGRADGRT
jgi:hypothetical protein